MPAQLLLQPVADLAHTSKLAALPLRPVVASAQVSVLPLVARSEAQDLEVRDSDQAVPLEDSLLLQD